MEKIKLSDQELGSSFHDQTITTTPQALIDLIGHPQWEDNTGDDKVNFDWSCELEDGTYFTIYDWKEYRSLNLNERIEFHIGGMNKSDTVKARQALISCL